LLRPEDAPDPRRLDPVGSGHVRDHGRSGASALALRPRHPPARVPSAGRSRAEPLYVLVDTAIVGHLGRPQLAALGIAGALLTGLYGLFNFLAYATTAHVARYDGAGQRRLADSVAAQSLWLSLAIGAALLALAASLADPA